MVLSFELESRLEQFFVQVKSSVCAEIDAKAQSLRELINWEISQQRKELLDTMTTIGLTTDQNNREQVLVKGEQANNSPNDATKAGYDNSQKRQQHNTPIEASNENNQSMDDSLVESAIISSNNNRQLIFSKSQQANIVAPIKVEDEEEEVELDNLDDDDCDCPDCQSSNGISDQMENGEIIQQPDNSNDEAPVPRKKRKNWPLPNITIYSQPGPSSSNSQSSAISNPATNLHLNDPDAAYICTYPECGRTFRRVDYLRIHRRTHNSQRPFRCCWEACTYAGNNSGQVKQHIRKAHFKLPQTLREIAELGLTEPADPGQWIEVLEEFL